MGILKLHGEPADHEDLFLQRYRRLLAWALEVAGRDRAAAEDLVQDAFVHFTLARPDLAAIANVDGYLYTTIRNLRLSAVRRHTRVAVEPLTVLDHDSAASGLRAADPCARLEAEQALHRICDFACARKASSKAASVLILRFFHGLLPSEVARVLASPRRAADDLLRTARVEAKAHLATARPFQESRPPAPTTGDCLRDVRAAIFRASEGECLPEDRLRRLYGLPARRLHRLALATRTGWPATSDAPEPIDTARLAHLVSCRRCLATICNGLGVAAPVDADSSEPPDTPAADCTDDGGAGASDGGRPDVDNDRLRRSMTRRTAEVFEHRPEALTIAANGLPLCRHVVGGACTDLTLNLNLDEPLGFVEVFSDQGVRLLVLMVDGPPAGDALQRARVKLSDDRTLEVAVDFSSTQPTVRTTYREPVGLREPQPAVPDEAAAAPAPAEHDPAPEVRTDRPSRWRLRLAGAFATIAVFWVLGSTTGAFDAIARVTLSALRGVGLLAPVSSPVLPGRPLGAVMLPMPAILRGSAASLAVASAEPDRPPDSAELARLEVDVLERLDRLGALVSDEIDLSRPAPHTLRLAASFADPARAGELTGVLGSVLARPGLELRITVVDPAASAGATAAGAGISPLRALEVEPNASAASATLREYVAARAPAQDVDGEVTRISQRFYRRARTVLRHARALASVADRFDPAALRALDAEAYLGWRSLIERHAAGAAHETEALRLELDPILFPDRAFEAPLDTAAAHLPLNDAVRALLDAAALQDDAIGAAFAASAVPRPEVDLEGLRRLARRIEVASAAIPGAVER